MTGGKGSVVCDQNKSTTDKQRADKHLADRNLVDSYATTTTATAAVINRHMLVPGCRVECITEDNRGLAAQTRARWHTHPLDLPSPHTYLI